MNLADAIRKAQGDPVMGATQPTPEPPKKQEAVKVSMPGVTQAEGEAPDNASPHVNGNVVRLELFLSAEQMGGLFRAIMAGQHTVLTVREAASYLRISQDALVKLAEDGEIPGVLLDGRWRFPKPNLDDWLTMQSVGQEDSEDVA